MPYDCPAFHSLYIHLCSSLPSFLTTVAIEQEPPPPKAPKPLPRPDDPHRKKRAGKRVRRQKEKTAPTRLHKEMNRMKFGEIGDDLIQTKIGFDLGMVGKSGSGRVRV